MTSDRSDTDSASKLSGIQVLRALAALLVLLLHSLRALRNNYGIAPFGHFYVGAAGVDLFFVISGFIMVHSTRGVPRNAGSSLRFMFRRILRVVPLYWIILPIHAAVLVLQGKFSAFVVPKIISTFLFISYPDESGSPIPFYIVGWTLNYEMFFYTLFAISLVLPRLESYALTTAVLVGLVVLNLFEVLPVPIKFWGHPIVIEFLLGMGIGILELLTFRMPRSAAASLCIAGALILVIAEISGYSPAPPIGPLSNSRFIIWGVPCALVVSSFTLSDFAHVSNRNFFVNVGDISYSIYLIHLVIISSLRPAVLVLINASARPEIAVSLFVGTVLMITLYISSLSYKYIERPIYRYLINRTCKL